VFCRHSSLEFFLERLDSPCGCCFGDSLLEDRKIWKFSFQQMFCGEFWFFVYAYYLFCFVGINTKEMSLAIFK
jgi:hypothetical protein